MRTSQVIRRGRIAAGAALLVAGLAGVPTAEALPEISSLYEAGQYLLFALIFGLGPALGALLACFSPDRGTATKRTILYGAIAAGLPPIVASVFGRSGGVAFLAIISSMWGAAMAIPTLPLVHAVVDAKSEPSHDALDRVFAMALGFLAVVKLPEAGGALLLNEKAVAAIIAGVGALGAIGFVLVQVRRRRRAARVHAILERVDDDLRLVPVVGGDDRAALLSGEPRFTVVRSVGSASYREGEQQTVLCVVPETPVQPDLPADVLRIGLTAAVAVFLSLVAAVLAGIAMSA